MQIIHKGRKGLITKANKRVLGDSIIWEGKRPIKISSVTIVKVEDTLFFIRNGVGSEHQLPMIFVPHKTFFDIYRSFVYKLSIIKDGEYLCGDEFTKVLSTVLEEHSPKTINEVKFILESHPSFKTDTVIKTDLISMEH